MKFAKLTIYSVPGGWPKDRKDIPHDVILYSFENVDVVSPYATEGIVLASKDGKVIAKVEVSDDHCISIMESSIEITGFLVEPSPAEIGSEYVSWRLE